MIGWWSLQYMGSRHSKGAMARLRYSEEGQNDALTTGESGEQVLFRQASYPRRT